MADKTESAMMRSEQGTACFSRHTFKVLSAYIEQRTPTFIESRPNWYPSVKSWSWSMYWESDTKVSIGILALPYPFNIWP